MKPWQIVVGLVAVFLLAFAYYAISPLFRNIKIDEALPGMEGVVEEKTENESVEEKEVLPPQTPNPQSAQPASFEVVGTLGHPASGSVRIVESDGKNYVRYENYKTINGPDIFVYLSKDLDAKEFIDLGKVRATEGNINYEIPDGVRAEDYRYVITWCKAFGVLFNYADIQKL